MQQIISQYDDDISFTMRMDEASIDNLVRILRWPQIWRLIGTKAWHFGAAKGLHHVG